MNKIITIAREYGSGGRETGIKLADKLGLKFYDKEIIAMAAEAGGLDADFVAKHEESAPAFMSAGYANQAFASFAYQPSYSDTIYFKQCDILKQIAAQGPCVIVGRCADYILRDYNITKVFVYSDLESKIARKLSLVPEGEAKSREQMEKDIIKINKGRRKYYEHYSGNRWGDMANFDLCISTSEIGVDGAVETILAYLNQTK